MTALGEEIQVGAADLLGVHAPKSRSGTARADQNDERPALARRPLVSSDADPGYLITCVVTVVGTANAFALSLIRTF